MTIIYIKFKLIAMYFTKRKALIFSGFLTLFIFFSCRSTSGVKKLNPIYITNSKKVELLPPECISREISTQQLLEGSFGQNNFALLSYLQADEEGIFINLFNEFGAGMGELSYDGSKVTFDSAVFPKNLKAEYIINDLQFVYYDEKALIQVYKNAGLELKIECEEKTIAGNLEKQQKEKRLLFEKDNLICEAVLDGKKIQIKNHLRKYSYTLTEAE